MSCTSTLGPGASAPVDIAVSAPAAGAYNTVATVASTTIADPNPANNAATVGLTVLPAPAAVLPAQPCTVLKLKGLSVSFTETALRALHCTVGRVTRKPSTSVGKGNVISTSPGAGTFAAGAKVAIVQSSGRPKKRKNKK